MQAVVEHRQGQLGRGIVGIALGDRQGGEERALNLARLLEGQEVRPLAPGRNDHVVVGLLDGGREEDDRSCRVGHEGVAVGLLVIGKGVAEVAVVDAVVAFVDADARKVALGPTTQGFSTPAAMRSRCTLSAAERVSCEVKTIQASR